MKYAIDHEFSTSEINTETPRQISVKPGAKSPEQFIFSKQCLELRVNF